MIKYFNLIVGIIGTIAMGVCVNRKDWEWATLNGVMSFINLWFACSGGMS